MPNMADDNWETPKDLSQETTKWSRGYRWDWVFSKGGVQ